MVGALNVGWVIGFRRNADSVNYVTFCDFVRMVSFVCRKTFEVVLLVS